MHDYVWITPQFSSKDTDVEQMVLTESVCKPRPQTYLLLSRLVRLLMYVRYVL